ncbi:hypothetical protein [Paraburkholderia sp. CNPSo 3274]|nr:hypothetical protein [Paraburkholderia sp. CNPSo 3274]
MDRLSYSIVILSNAYLCYVWVPWKNKSVYLGAVDLMRDVCLL